MTTEAALPQDVPVLRDPLNPNIAQPIYAGADPRNTQGPSDPVLRGDDPAAVVTPPAEPTKEAAPETPPETPTAEERPRDDKGKFIPRPRFEEVNDRMKRAEAELARIAAEKDAASKAAEEAYDFNAAETAYMELVLDGKLADAAVKRAEIRAAERAEFTKAARTEAANVNTQMTVQQRINTLTSQFEADYDVFDPESENYNEAVIDTAQALVVGYGQSGRYKDGAEAFKAAVLTALKAHGVAVKDDAAAPEPRTTPAAAAPRTAERRVDAITRQPPNLAGVGTSNANAGDTAIDVSTLSDADLKRLPAATIARLRGDFV